MRYWAEHPPAHIILGAVHGKGKPTKKGMQELRGEMEKFGLGRIVGPLPAVYRDK